MLPAPPPYCALGAADIGARAEAILDMDAGAAACLTDGVLVEGAATVAGAAAIRGFLMVP